MAITFGKNLQAQSTIGSLNKATSGLSQAYQRLGSGLRINTAADDPAGLAVSTALGSKIRVLNRGKLNVSDSISVLNLADGATGTISSILTKMSELAEQAANGTLSKTQRQALQSEYTALDREIRRITASTKFNGLELLSGGEYNATEETLDSTSTNTDDPAVSADGRYVAYVSSGIGQIDLIDTLTGETTVIPSIAGGVSEIVSVLANGDLIVEAGVFEENVVYYDLSEGTSSALTDSAVGHNVNDVAVSADGTTIAFMSTTQYQDGGTKDDVLGTGIETMYILDVETGIIHDTGVTGTVDRVALSADGTKTFFRRDDAGTLNGYLIDTSSGDYSASVVADMGGGFGIASLTNEGILTFASASDLTGENGSAYRQIFTLNLNTATFDQLTNFTDSSVATDINGSEDGSIVTFHSVGDFTGENSGGQRQAFRFNTLTGELEQVTDFTSSKITTSSAFSDDGYTLIYRDATNAIISVGISPEANEIDIEAGFGAEGRIVASIQSVEAELRGLGSYAITGQEVAAAAVEGLGRALDSLGILRGDIGAALSRLESADRLLAGQSLENTAARARIREADIAAETADMIRYQILRDSSVALLAQANLQPEIALSLLPNS